MSARPDRTGAPSGEVARPDWSRPSLADARSRARELDHLNAFISFTDEEGDGPVLAVKDLVDVRGTVTTGGGILLPSEPALEDAPAVRRARDHGCVVIGKTNLHEWAFGATSVNTHYGNVLNPHDPTRVAGGSSGGSAVAAATGMCAWAIGSDTGGSIRIPAALSGVVGLKPTIGSISLEGVIQLAESLDTLGPLAPDVASAALGFEIMSGREVLPRAPAPELGDLRIGVPAGWVAGLDEQTQAAWSAVSEGLPEADFPDRQPVYEPGMTILAYEAARYHHDWLEAHDDRYGPDVLRHLRQGQEIAEADYRLALGRCEGLRDEVEAAMAGWDAILLPTTAWVAPRPDAKNIREPLTAFTRPFNTTGHPVLVIPAPVDGLPVGIQIVGRFDDEAGLIRVGLALERAWSERRGGA